MGGGYRPAWGVKEVGEGEVVVDKGDGDGGGDGDGVEVVDPPNDPPPSPNGFSKQWAPSLPPPEEQGCAWDQQVFPPPLIAT